MLKSRKFGTSNEDEKLQLFYILAITELLGDQKICPVRSVTDANSPKISFFDETLSKALPLIDENWVQKPTGSTKKSEDSPTTEQIIQWQQNSLESYQQMDLRKLRDQILLNVSNLIDLRKNDDAFKQQMLKRFSKNDACRKIIAGHLKDK